MASNGGSVHYGTIVADPPWEYDEGFVVSNARVIRPLPYPSMPIDEILELPVRRMAATNCRLFLWATNRWMDDAFDVVRAWGFKYVQTLVWDKPDYNPNTGSLCPNPEFLLVGRRGAPKRLSRLPGPILRAHGGEHSQKPEMWMDYIEAVSPGPYLELFSRRARFGWDTWGNEALEGEELMVSGL